MAEAKRGDEAALGYEPPRNDPAIPRLAPLWVMAIVLFVLVNATTVFMDMDGGLFGLEGRHVQPPFRVLSGIGVGTCALLVVRNRRRRWWAVLMLLVYAALFLPAVLP